MDWGGRPLNTPAETRSSNGIVGRECPTNKKSITFTGDRDPPSGSASATSSAFEKTDLFAVIRMRSLASSHSLTFSTMPTVVMLWDASSSSSLDR